MNNVNTADVNLQKTTLTEHQTSLIEYISGPETAFIGKCIQHVLDIAIYHSNIPLGDEEKLSLLAVKQLGKKIGMCGDA